MKTTALKIFIFPAAACIWAVILGTIHFLFGKAYIIAGIGNTFFFILLSCLILKKNRYRILAAALFMGCSFFAGIPIERHLMDKKLYSFDLNGDGIFSGDEITEEQDEYFMMVINDTNVLFRYIISFPYSLFAAAIGVPLFNLLRYLLRLYKTSHIRRTGFRMPDNVHLLEQANGNFDVAVTDVCGMVTVFKDISKQNTARFSRQSWPGAAMINSVCCFCGNVIYHDDLLTLRIYSNSEGDDGSQCIYCHRKCLRSCIGKEVPLFFETVLRPN